MSSTDGNYVSTTNLYVYGNLFSANLSVGAGSSVSFPAGSISASCISGLPPGGIGLAGNVSATQAYIPFSATAAGAGVASMYTSGNFWYNAPSNTANCNVSGAAGSATQLSVAGNSAASASYNVVLVNNGNAGGLGSYAPATCGVGVQPSTNTVTCAGVNPALGPAGPLSIGGSITTGSLSLGGAAQTGAINIGGNAATPISLLGNLSVGGNLTTSGNVSVTSGVLSVGAAGGLAVASTASFTKQVGFNMGGTAYALLLENGSGMYVKGGQIQMGTGAAGYLCSFNLQTDASAGGGPYPVKFWDTKFDQTYAAASVPNEIMQLKGYLTAYSGINFNRYGTAPTSAITYNFIGYNSVLQDYNLNIAGINSTSTGTVLTSSLKYLKGSALYYQPSSYGGVLSVSAATAKLLSVANAGTLCAWYHITVTYTATTPVLTLPDPVAALAGCEVKFVRAGPSNALSLTTSTPASSNFLVSATATNINPTFSLNATWYKVGFVCLPNPDATLTPYCWQQTLYQ